jgi:hypothetical protein
MRQYRFGVAVLVVTFVQATSAGPADARGPSLDRLPVAGTVAVPAAEYASASALAERGGTPVEIALAVAGPFEGSTQHVIQLNQGAEAPSASRVTVIRDGLLDDSVRGDRWEVALERTQAGGWTIKEVKRAWRCRRGGAPDRFVATRCL